METDLINKEWNTLKGYLRISDIPDYELTGEKKWFLIGLTYILARLSELPDELTDEQIGDFYDDLMIEAQMEMLNLDEI